MATTEDPLRGLFSELGVVPAEGSGWLRFAALLEALRDQGFVVVLKWDGGRDPAAGDNGPYTALISGGPLVATGEFFRTDGSSMEEALTDVLRWLAEAWPGRG